MLNLKDDAINNDTQQPQVKDVCEFVAAWFNFHFPGVYAQPITGRQIFNYSPSGELFMIWEWWEKALADKKFMATQELDELRGKHIIN